MAAAPAGEEEQAGRKGKQKVSRKERLQRKRDQKRAERQAGSDDEDLHQGNIFLLWYSCFVCCMAYRNKVRHTCHLPCVCVDRGLTSIKNQVLCLSGPMCRDDDTVQGVLVIELHYSVVDSCSTIQHHNLLV